jgi:hypothetical protein
MTMKTTRRTLRAENTQLRERLAAEQSVPRKNLKATLAALRTENAAKDKTLAELRADNKAKDETIAVLSAKPEAK